MAALGTRLLTLTIGGDEVAAQTSKAVITSGASESDLTTFAEAAAGGARDYKLALACVQDLAADTVWDTIWTASGTSVACVLKPYGNAAPSVAQPHFTFNAIVSEPDGDFLGGEANSAASGRMAFEVEWAIIGKPVKVTGA